MKGSILSVTLGLLALLITTGVAQSPSVDEQQVLALVKEIQAQQGRIAENQTKIEAKMADLAETIRVARLFAGKAGK